MVGFTAGLSGCSGLGVTLKMNFRVRQLTRQRVRGARLGDRPPGQQTQRPLADRGLRTAAASESGAGESVPKAIFAAVSLNNVCSEIPGYTTRALPAALQLPAATGGKKA